MTAGELIVVRSGVNTGDCAVVPKHLEGSYAAYDLIIRLIDEVLPEFAVLFLDTRLGRTQLNIRKGRAAQPHLNAEEISSILIPLPLPSVQRALVAEMEAARESRRRKLAEADALLSGLDAFLLDKLGLTRPKLDSRFVYAVRLGEVKGSRCDAIFHLPQIRSIDNLVKSMKSNKKRLGDISQELAGGATPSRNNHELYANDGINFLRIMNVAPFEIRFDDMKYITPDVHVRMLSRSQLQSNDIVMTITGRVGTSAVVAPEVLPANINQHIVRIRLKDDSVQPEYLAAYLNSSIGLALTNRGVTGGTRIAVDYETIRNLIIPVPDEKTQRKIVDELTRRRTEARRLREDAALEWDAAKARFELKLLGDKKA